MQGSRNSSFMKFYTVNKKQVVFMIINSNIGIFLISEKV